MDPDSFSIISIFNGVTIQPISLSVIIALITATLLLFASAFVSASEVAFFSLEPSDIQEIRSRKHINDIVVETLLERSEYLLATILIANNFVNVAVVMLFTFAFHNFFSFEDFPLLGFILETVALTFLLLLFGEIIPKSYAKKNALGYVRRSGPTLSVIGKIVRPLAKVLVGSTGLINRLTSKNRNNTPSVDDLYKALELTSDSISEEKEMLTEIIKFYNKTANEIMTPRVDMADIDIKQNFHEVIKFIIDSGYSRIPVYVQTEDHIKGILYIKDLIPYIDKPATFRWQSLIRSAYFVPETKKIDDLLEEFRANKMHMAIVVDEFGGTSGLVTMEDILEEIVGEISDEHDDDEEQFSRLSDGSWIFEAKIPLNDFFRETEADEEIFSDVSEEVETLGGLVLEIKGDFPEKGERIIYKKHTFIILEVDDRRILKIRFFPPKEEKYEE